MKTFKMQSFFIDVRYLEAVQRQNLIISLPESYNVTWVLVKFDGSLITTEPDATRT